MTSILMLLGKHNQALPVLVLQPQVGKSATNQSHYHSLTQQRHQAWPAHTTPISPTTATIAALSIHQKADADEERDLKTRHTRNELAPGLAIRVDIRRTHQGKRDRNGKAQAK